MITNLLMGLLVLVLVLITLLGIKYDQTKKEFMSLNDTIFLRGFWCIIVILVHIPDAYQNRIQDMVGSFAFIGVTFFFMTSGYGLKWNFKHKEGYLDHFWKKRLPPIIIPALLANIFLVLMKYINGNTLSVLSFLNINDWVKVLLLYYFIFWIIHKCFKIFKIKNENFPDIIICILVVLFSLLDKLTDIKITFIWTVEPLGFAYGIILAKYKDKIINNITNRWPFRIILTICTSLLLGVIYLKFKNVYFYGDYLLKILLGISITLLIFIALAKFKVGNRINSFLANISYEIYILHYGIIALMTYIGSLINLDSGLYIFMCIVFTIIFSYLLKLLCKPVLRLFK